ncbi:MAG: serine dehydrogenase [Candidatus Eremiobacteraeota bacterium]|nr:serine dehydrogenase [Candidatus Eremiobacteraeota bacterium]
MLIDAIFGFSLTLCEELLDGADPKQDLHLLLSTPGGDGEVAIRLARTLQSRCRELTVIVPAQAKSAGTLLALGAHHIVMGPAGDLGPVDPQLMLQPGKLVSAKDIIATVDDAAARIEQRPQTYPLYASLMSDITGIVVQQARSALARTNDQLMEAIKANPDRNHDQAEELRAKLQKPLIESSATHAAIFGAVEAEQFGLPVDRVDVSSDQWKLLWRLWTSYFSLGQRFYESSRCSQQFPQL